MSLLASLCLHQVRLLSTADLRVINVAEEPLLQV